MRYIIGLLCFAGGAWLLWSAYARKRRVVAAGPLSAPPLHPSLQMLGDAMPPIIVLALVIVGAKMALAFAVTEAGQHLSLFDLAGFLFLLAGYGTSVVFRARYRAALPPR
jgi:hypothetical protein